MERRDEDNINGDRQSTENAPFRLVRMLIDETTTESNDSQLSLTRNVQPSMDVEQRETSVASSDMSFLSFLTSSTPNEAASSTFSNVNEQLLDNEEDRSNTNEGAPFVPTDDDSSESDRDYEDDDGRQWCVPCVRRSSSPPYTRTSLFNQLLLRPIPHPPISWFHSQQPSWYQGGELRGRGRVQLAYRFPSALDPRPPCDARSTILQNVFPDKPEPIRIGNRSFQPTATFDNVPEAKPAKPRASGFSRCHEKALAAKCVHDVIRGRTTFADGFPGCIDIFNRFWNETDTHWEENSGSNSDSEIGNRPTTTFQDTEYVRWESETSVNNNSRLSQIWNALSESSTSSLPPLLRLMYNNPSTMSIGVGTRYPGTNEENQAFAAYDSSESTTDDDNDMEMASNIMGNTIGSLQDHSYQFMGEFLSEETVSRMFLIDIPHIPPLTLTSSMCTDQIPLPFVGNMHQTCTSIQLGVNQLTSTNIDNNENDSNDTGSEEESVFTLVPDVDRTPSISEHLLNYQSTEMTPSNEVYSDDGSAPGNPPPPPIEDVDVDFL